MHVIRIHQAPKPNNLAANITLHPEHSLFDFMALRRAAVALAQRISGFEAEGVASMLGGAPRCLEAMTAEAQRQASNQAVKQRIRAIKNIGKITKAMKVCSFVDVMMFVDDDVR